MVLLSRPLTASAILIAMADFYIHRGPYRPRENLDDSEYVRVPMWVRIILDGPQKQLAVRSRFQSLWCSHLTVTVSQMVIPTCDRVDLHPGLFEHWVPAIQGPAFTRCEGTDEQREQMLHIALAIHAFTEGFAGVDPDDYHHFIGRVVEAALSVQPDERAEGRIEELVEWLHSELPQVRLVTSSSC